MGQTLSRVHFFDQVTGRPNLYVLTITTCFWVSAYMNTFLFGFGRVKDNSMAPYMRTVGSPFSDVVRYRKFINNGEKLQGKIVALRDPFSPTNIVYRTVIAVEDQWVQRQDNGGIIKVPKGHVWIECENPNERSLDSLSDEIGGPISIKYLLGPCYRIVWPIWRYCTFTEQFKYQSLHGYSQDKGQHSKVYSNEEIYKRYGIR